MRPASTQGGYDDDDDDDDLGISDGHCPKCTHESDECSVTEPCCGVSHDVDLDWTEDPTQITGSD